MKQHTRLTAYEESAATTAHEIERLRHGWNYTHMLLDITHDEVETRTHEIVHLEHHMVVLDAKLEERAKMIADLEQQLLELPVQAPPDPVDHQEAIAVSGIDED
jgi:hypothetical protein